MWIKESSHKYCPNNTARTVDNNQYQCEALCEADTGCVGISYSYKVGMTQHCFLCKDDTLGRAINEFGFYRNINFKGKIF